MIPKIIHYCWFGGNPLPPLAQECIASWKKYLPDYEIIQWSEKPLYENENQNENSLGGSFADKVMYFDPNIIPYTAEAYRQRKYAFVSDYARFWIIWHYGGLYFDTDVEIIRPLYDIIAQGNFMGFEQDPDGVNTPGRYAPRYCFDVALGLGFGMAPQHPFMKRLIDYYGTLGFEMPPADISWYKTIVAYTTEELCKLGLKNTKRIQTVFSNTDNTNLSITVYPSEYFAPINAITGRLHITPKTKTIHRYASSWNEKQQKTAVEIVKHYLPEWVLIAINRWKRRNYRIDQIEN